MCHLLRNDWHDGGEARQVFLPMSEGAVREFGRCLDLMEGASSVGKRAWHECRCGEHDETVQPEGQPRTAGNTSQKGTTKMRGKPAVTCVARAKSTGERCGRAPIPGGTVCKFHGGGTRAAKAAGQRRLAQAAVRSELERWEKREAVREAAIAPWAHEIVFRAPNISWADPRDIRRVAREMTAAAGLLRDAARALEEELDLC